MQDPSEIYGILFLQFLRKKCWCSTASNIYFLPNTFKKQKLRLIWFNFLINKIIKILISNKSAKVKLMFCKQSQIYGQLMSKVSKQTLISVTRQKEFYIFIIYMDTLIFHKVEQIFECSACVHSGYSVVLPCTIWNA